MGFVLYKQEVSVRNAKKIFLKEKTVFSFFLFVHIRTDLTCLNFNARTKNTGFRHLLKVLPFFKLVDTIIDYLGP